MNRPKALRLSYGQFAELESRDLMFEQQPRIRIDKQNKKVRLKFRRETDRTLARLSV